MDKLVNIIEIIDGRYLLNNDLLHSALTLADNCDNIALISIVGTKGQGKTFFINCLFNYMKSDHKDEWPHSEDALIQIDSMPHLNGYNTTPVIKLTSSPFIITDEIENKIIKTAVFLMDSDFVFDNEMSSQQVQDIIELFLLTSSTVISNHKGFLLPQEFLSLKKISSYINSSLDSLKDIIFLIRDWIPETKNNKFSFGLYEGSKYIENFIESMNLDQNFHDLNCFLMPKPDIDTQTEVIKLFELNKQFSDHLKNLLVFKLLNIEEMLKKKHPNTNEYMNARDMFELFENCIVKLNQDIDTDLWFENWSTGVNNSNTEDQSTDETDVINFQTDLEIKASNYVFKEGLSPISESRLDNSISIIDSFKHDEDNGFIKLNEENGVNKTKESNFPGFDLNDQTYDVESYDSSDSYEEGSHDLYDESFSIKDRCFKNCTNEDGSVQSLSLEEHCFYKDCINEEFRDSMNLLVTESKIETRETNLKKSPAKIMYEIGNSLMDNVIEEVKESKINYPLEYKSMPIINESLHEDSRKIHDSDSDYLSKTEQIKKISENLLEENKDIEIKNQFKDLVNELILEYNKSVGIKLDDQFFDLDRNFKETHLSIKQKILENFEIKSVDIKPLLIARKHRDKYYVELNDKMEEAIKTYKNKFKVKLNEAHNQYHKVLKQISGLYKINLKSSIMNQLKGDLHKTSLIHIQRICEEKAFDIFKERTFEFLKGNIETELLSKWNEMMNQINCNFQIVWDHYREYESAKQQIFSNLIYYSDDKIKEFHENQKSRIIDSIQKLKDSDMIELTTFLLEKSFDAFSERNNYIEKKERNFALKAIELAFKIFSDCFEAKLRTGFFERNEVNNICDQLLEFTTKQLIASCDFNLYQNYLIEHCKDGLKLKIEEIRERELNKYQEKVKLILKKLTKASEEALEYYCYSMRNKGIPAQKMPYLKSNEFTELHHKYSEMAIKSYNRSTEFLNQDFDLEFVNKVLVENQSHLRKLITNKKQNLKTINDKNTPNIHSIAIHLGKQYIIAATHRNSEYEIISDKFDQKLRPNSISFGDEILIGSEAKNHYETLYPDIVSFKNFDIKQLLGRERSNVSNEELSEFPFSFYTDKLSVHLEYHDLKIGLSIESLLAFMILDITLSAEKQIGNIISNIVLTVPTNYTINQKNAVRNVAKIAGFKDCDIISEISAAAISYAVRKQSFPSKFNDNVLFVIINDYECDVAICGITNNKIEYKIYFHKTLNSIEEEKSNFFNKTMKNNRKTEENDNNITKLKFKELMDQVYKKSNLKSVNLIDECVIAGNSLLIPDIKIWINKYVKTFPSMISNSVDIIIKGSAIYSKMMVNKIKFIEISEVTTHNLYLDFETKSSKKRKTEVMLKNISLPKDKSISFSLPKSSDLPLKIIVSQDNQIVTTRLIEELPDFDKSIHGFNQHFIDFSVNCFGEIYITSFISNKKRTSSIKLNSIKINPGLNDKDLREENQKLHSLINKMEGKLCIGKSIRELKTYCLTVKNEVDNNLKLRPVMKKQILLEIERTLSFLSGEHLDLNDITKKKQILDKSLEVYMQR